MEEIPDFDPRAGQAAAGKGSRFRTFNPARLDIELCSLMAISARGQRHPADRADRGQGLAAKAHGVNIEQIDAAIFARAQFRSRMPLQRQKHVVAAHAAAIIFDNQALETAIFNAHLDRTRACIKRVLDQLFHRRSRAFDHLSGSDAIDRIWRQLADLRPRGKSRAIRHVLKVGGLADSHQRWPQRKSGCRSNRLFNPQL